MSFEDEVLRYWRQDYDTQEIAKLLQAKERDVYAVIAHRNDKPAKEITLDTRSYRPRHRNAELPYGVYYPNRFARKEERP